MREDSFHNTVFTSRVVYLTRDILYTFTLFGERHQHSFLAIFHKCCLPSLKHKKKCLNVRFLLKKSNLLVLTSERYSCYSLLYEAPRRIASPLCWEARVWLARVVQRYNRLPFPCKSDH